MKYVRPLHIMITRTWNISTQANNKETDHRHTQKNTYIYRIKTLDLFSESFDLEGGINSTIHLRPLSRILN